MDNREKILEGEDGGWVDTHHYEPTNELIPEMRIKEKKSHNEPKLINGDEDDEDDDEEAGDMDAFMAAGVVEDDDDVFLLNLTY